MSTLAEQCAQGLAAVQERTRQRHATRLAGYTIKFFDGTFDLQHLVRAEDSIDYELIENDTGGGSVVTDGDVPAAQWLWDLKGRMDLDQTIDAFVVIEYVGIRLCGRVSDVTMHIDDLGAVKITAELEDDYEQLKSRVLYPTPTTPAGFQPIKVFPCGGPATWAAATSLWLNLARAHGNPVSGWTSDPVSVTNADYRAWPIVIKPFSYDDAVASGVTDGLVLSRMKNWHEACAAMLNDADVTVVTRRYLPDDPPPWEGANLAYGTLVISFEYQGDLFDEVSGNIWSGIGELVRIFVNSFVEGLGGNSPLPVETRPESMTGQTVPPIYQRPGYIGTQPLRPYVFYPAGSPGIVSFEAHKKPAKYLRFTAGGHSMPGVNEMLLALVNIIGDAVAAIPLAPIPPLGGVASALIGPFITDVILAFMTVYLQYRAGHASRFGPYEKFLTGTDKAYTLSAAMVLRTAIKDTNTQFSAQIEIADGAPWWVGGDGQGDMRLGTRILLQTPAKWDQRIYSQRIKKLKLSASRGSAPTWEPTIGSIEPSEDPFAKGMRELERIAGALKQAGVF